MRLDEEVRGRQTRKIVDSGADVGQIASQVAGDAARQRTAVCRDGRVLTRDLGGSASTTEVGDALLAAM